MSGDPLLQEYPDIASSIKLYSKPVMSNQSIANFFFQNAMDSMSCAVSVVIFHKKRVDHHCSKLKAPKHPDQIQVFNSSINFYTCHWHRKIRLSGTNALQQH